MISKENKETILTQKLFNVELQLYEAKVDLMIYDVCSGYETHTEPQKAKILQLEQAKDILTKALEGLEE